MSDYETRQYKRNIVVGLFVIVGLGALVYLIGMFGDLPIWTSRLKSYKVIVQFRRAPGVQVDTPVRFAGYQIGRVTKVRPPRIMKEVEGDRVYHQTISVLSINKEFDNIPNDVDVQLITRGLGSSYIEFRLTSYDVDRPGVEFLKDGSQLQGSTGVTSEFFPAESQQKLDELVRGLTKLIRNANEVIGDKDNKDNLSRALAHTAEATEQATKTLQEFETFCSTGTSTLKSANGRINDLVTSMVETSSELTTSFKDLAGAIKNTLKKTDTGIDKSVVAFVNTSEQLSKTSVELRLLLEKVNNGQGTAARFVNDGKLYEEMLESSRQLQKLLVEIRAFVSESKTDGLPLNIK